MLSELKKSTIRYATPREAPQALQVSEKTLRNWDREGLLSFLGQVLCGNVREVVVNRKDRLVRLGLDLIEWFGQQKNCFLVVLNRSDLLMSRICLSKGRQFKRLRYRLRKAAQKIRLKIRNLVDELHRQAANYLCLLLN